MLDSGLSGLLDQAGNVLASACPDIATVQRATITIDDMGGTSQSWASPTIVCQDVPANFQVANVKEREDFARRGVLISHRIYLYTDRDVQLGDRIPHPTMAGLYYSIIYMADMGGAHLAMKIYANLVR